MSDKGTLSVKRKESKMATVEWASESYTRSACSSCGVIFYMPASYVQKRQEDHATFWCPNGHNQYYPGKTDAEKYEELYKKEQACCKVKSDKLRAVSDEAEHLTHSVNGYKGKVKQLQNQLKTAD